MSGVTAPSRPRASTPPGRCRAKRRLRCGPPSARGGSTACSRTPPGSTPSTHGWASSSRRPATPARRTASGRRSSASTRTAARSTPRPRSTQTAPSPLTSRSVTDAVGGQLRQRPQADQLLEHAPRRPRPAVVAEGGGVLGHERVDRGGRRPDPARMARLHRGVERPRPRVHDATASASTAADHGIRAPTDAVAAGAGEQPALGVARHVRVVGEVVQVGDAEVGDHLVDDVGAGPPAPGDEAQVGRHAGRLRGRRGGATPRHRRRPGPGCAARRARRPGRRRPARAGAPDWLSGRSSTTRAGPAGQRGDHVAGRGLGHARRAHRRERRARRTPPRRAAPAAAPRAAPGRGRGEGRPTAARAGARCRR